MSSMFSPEPDRPEGPAQPSEPLAPPNAKDRSLSREVFAKSGIGCEVSPGHLVLSRQAFLFACGIIHFPDPQAREALRPLLDRNALGRREDGLSGSRARTELPEDTIAAPLGSYFVRLRDAYSANAMSRRAIMSVSGRNRYQQLLLDLAPQTGLFDGREGHLPQALSYATEPWTVVLSEDFATKNRIARNEVTWLEFARGFAQAASRDESMAQDLLERGFEALGTYFASGRLSPADAMRFAGLDTSPFSRYSLWYFHAAPDTIASGSCKGTARELAQDHTKRSIFFKKLVRDAASFFAAQGDEDELETLRACSRIAVAAYEDALDRVSRLVKVLPLS